MVTLLCGEKAIDGRQICSVCNYDHFIGCDHIVLEPETYLSITLLPSPGIIDFQIPHSSQNGPSRLVVLETNLLPRSAGRTLTYSS